ncbi:MAG TPA: hypothetical protein VMH26_15370 [Burkholderiales bacterium]|nr:hypothetical protein [Burkholderiales bacterium]
MDDTVRVAALTTCEVGEGGAEIRLRMLDEAGRQVILEFPAGLGCSLILTLPHLMDRCLRRLHGNATRLVFPMHCWSLEAAMDTEALILTFQTPDGFSVAFAVSTDDARGLVEALQAHCARAAVAPPRILN